MDLEQQGLVSAAARCSLRPPWPLRCNRGRVQAKEPGWTDVMGSDDVEWANRESVDLSEYA
eukprot:SAG31_NODE_3273_length_4475_cov_14.400137_3_plen_61_part_00